MSAQAPCPISPARLLALAPTTTLRERGERYRGDTVTASIRELPSFDRANVRALYEFLLVVYDRSRADLERPQQGLAALRELVSSELFTELLARVRRLGATLRAADAPMSIRRSLHDVRGGSLMALLMHLDVIREDEALPNDLQRVFILSRDHLKMMRNALHDLDPARYQLDLQGRAHSVALLREKWTDVRYAPGAADAPATTTTVVRFHCDFEGAVSERCMEFSALDRVIYNLVNNAARHSVDGRVDVVVRAVDDFEDTDLRFAVINRVSAAQQAALRERFGDQLSELFRGGFTTGGHGIGLRICGDFVTHGYARASLDDALARRLLGAELIDGCFVAWFHWPGRRATSEVA